MGYINPSKEEQERFWLKVNKQGPDQCWPWTAYSSRKDRRGFMIFRKQGTPAPVLAYAIANGPFESNRQNLVCHTCNNANCVNPNHLYLGTHQTNSDDRAEAGTVNKGEDRYNSKLDWEKVRAIRKEYAGARIKWGLQKKLADRYGVDPSIISRIISNKEWKE